MYTAQRYHDISCGHRVHGHENKCAHLHGHNYRIWFFCEPNPNSEIKNDEIRTELDSVGRVVDFSVIKLRLCDWLEANWDHKFLIWQDDEVCLALRSLDPKGVIWTDFNPTAENMAAYLVNKIGPEVLAGTGVSLFKVTVEETAKCSATYIYEPEE